MEKNDKNSARGAELQTLQREPCGYFLHETNQANGLVIDKTAPNWPSSIAATGLALAFRAQSGAHRSHDRELSYWHVVATDEKLSSSRDWATARGLLQRVAMMGGSRFSWLRSSI